MKSIKIPIGSLVLIAACLMMPLQSAAQWSIGASYQMRDEVPENGFGIQLEREILKPIPILDFGLRAHFSYFSEENEASGSGVTVSQDFSFYDYGLAATAGLSFGLLKPYVGVGIGNNNIESDAEDDSNDFDNSSFFWDGFAGAQLTIIPKLHPFIEYRFQSAENPGDIEVDTESVGRVIIGLSLSF